MDVKPDIPGIEVIDRFHQYNRLVKTLEGLKRRDDLNLGQRLADKIQDHITTGQLPVPHAGELIERIKGWIRMRQYFFNSPEYQQMVVLRNQLSFDERRRNKINNR